MAACWSEMKSIHGINVWLAGAKCSQRHPTPGGQTKGVHDVDNTDEVCRLLISNWELMRNGSIYNTSWENQSRGTRSLSFNSSDFSFSHNNTENEYWVSWAWLESNTVMSSQLRLSCVRICSAHLGKSPALRPVHPALGNAADFSATWKVLNTDFSNVWISVLSGCQTLGRRKYDMLRTSPGPRHPNISVSSPGSESLKLMLRLWNTCLVEDGGGRSSHTRNKAGVTPCGFRSRQAPSSWTPAFCILALFSPYFLPLTFVYWRHSVALVLRII